MAPAAPPVRSSPAPHALAAGPLDGSVVPAADAPAPPDGGPNGAHNQLFFTAGPNNYADGLFGVITFAQ